MIEENLKKFYRYINWANNSGEEISKLKLADFTNKGGISK
jgi:hypothetical protein